MSNNIEIKSDKVLLLAKTIHDCNVDIEEEVENIKAVMNSLNGSWKSEVSYSIQSSFREFFKTNQKSRYDRMNNFSVFLGLNVSDSYEQVESNIENNAAHFK